MNKYLYLVVVFFITCTPTEKTHTEDTPEETLGKTVKLKRDYKYKLVKTNNFSYDIGVPFKVFYHKGIRWIIDSERQSIIELNVAGEILNEIGSKGGGPNENQRIKNVYIGSDRYGVIDNSKDIFKIVSLEYDTTLISHKFYDHIDRGVFLNDTILAITNAENQDLIINILNTNNKIIKKISLKNELNYDGNSMDLIYEGEFTKLNSNKLFCYFSYRHSFFICMNVSGEIKFIGKTIDNIPPPKPSFKTIGEYTMHGVEPDLMVNLKADVDNKRLYILSNVIKKINLKNRALDIYSLVSGAYEYSIKLPLLSDGQIPIDFDKEGNNIIVLYEDFDIVEYEIVPL